MEDKQIKRRSKEMWEKVEAAAQARAKEFGQAERDKRARRRKRAG